MKIIFYVSIPSSFEIPRHPSTHLLFNDIQFFWGFTWRWNGEGAKGEGGKRDEVLAGFGVRKASRPQKEEDASGTSGRIETRHEDLDDPADCGYGVVLGDDEVRMRFSNSMASAQRRSVSSSTRWISMGSLYC
jgi:hypothetical protein